MLHLLFCKFPQGRETCTVQQYAAKPAEKKDTTIARISMCICWNIYKCCMHVQKWGVWYSVLTKRQEPVLSCPVLSLCCRCQSEMQLCVFVLCYKRRPSSFLYCLSKLLTCLTCSFVVFFMRGHTVTTCWWHRLWTTQVHTDRKKTNKHQLSNFDYTFEKLCRKKRLKENKSFSPWHW